VVKMYVGVIKVCGLQTGTDHDPITYTCFPVQLSHFFSTAENNASSVSLLHDFTERPNSHIRAAGKSLLPVVTMIRILLVHYLHVVMFEVLTALIMKIQVSWDRMPCHFIV
jgi:hypothetical protein